jgi:hypothetical protein
MYHFRFHMIVVGIAVFCSSGLTTSAYCVQHYSHSMQMLHNITEAILAGYSKKLVGWALNITGNHHFLTPPPHHVT